MDMDMYPAADKSSEKSPENSEAETSLLPKAMFGGNCKVGDTYKVRVVAIHGDELEVEHAGEKKLDPKETEDDDMVNPVDRMME